MSRTGEETSYQEKCRAGLTGCNKEHIILNKNLSTRQRLKFYNSNKQSYKSRHAYTLRYKGSTFYNK